ncbi:hypothetical protein BH11MYX4_BH11MYX4_25150 [soil metagenome]
MSTLVRSAAAFFALTSFVIACSSTTSGTGSSSSGGTSGSSGSPKITTADCTTRCKTKATECGAPADQGASSCASLCDGSFTDAQLTCLEQKSCAQLNASGGTINSLCPDTSGGSSGSSGSSSGTSGSSGDKKALGDSCTCAGVSASSEGLCAGTSEECASGLSCIYGSGSSGKGTCMGASCCDKTSACDADKSLLKSCTAGSCKTAPIGYYCQK